MRPLPGALAPSDPAQASTCRLAPDRGDLPAVTSPDRTEPAATVVRLEALPDEFINGDRLTLNVVTTGGVAYGAGSVDQIRAGGRPRPKPGGQLHPPCPVASQPASSIRL